MGHGPKHPDPQRNTHRNNTRVRVGTIAPRQALGRDVKKRQYKKLPRAISEIKPHATHRPPLLCDAGVHTWSFSAASAAALQPKSLMASTRFACERMEFVLDLSKETTPLQYIYQQGVRFSPQISMESIFETATSYDRRAACRRLQQHEKNSCVIRYPLTQSTKSTTG